MDVKSTFLNGIREEEVYIENPEGFFDINNKNMVCRLHKALYGLKQEPRAWHERIHKYLVQIGFQRNDDNKNLYTKIEKGKGIFLSKFFIDDIIFGGQDVVCKYFVDQMKLEFEMSMFREKKLFVGLQVYQMKYVKEIMKFFGLED